MKDEREALAVANALPFGLAVYVYSRDLERAFAERIQSGTVGINVIDTTDIQAPFGGWKCPPWVASWGVRGCMSYRGTRLIRMRVRPFST